MDEHTILEAARNAFNAGLCPIRARADGTKAPLGEWKRYQTDRPELMEVDSWFANWPNLGLVCGQVSERLECLEFEGDFMDRFDEVADRLNRAGLYEEFETWINGYCEATPRDGLHILVHLEGDGRLPGNTKIAMSSVSETWIETRGEGGFVIVAPSNGATHPSGRSWKLAAGGFDQIAYTTLDVWNAVLGVLGSFDESPPAPTPPPILRPPPSNGDSWVNQALDTYPAITDVLAAHGWSFVRADSLGQLWRRPGKSFGHSGRLNLSGRLHVFSSSTPLPVGRTTFDALDVDLAYRLGRAPTRDERTTELRAYRAGPEPRAQLGPLADPERAETEGPVASTLCRPDDFWQARPYLTHIYVAALSRQTSPDAVWENLFANYMACIPPTFLLPEMGTLDWISLIAGGSSAGKSMAQDVGLWLMPTEVMGPNDVCTLGGVRLAMPEGSGEGLIEAYIKRDKSQHQIPGQYQFTGIGFYTDEGSFLHEINARQGNTTFSIMRSLWSGKATGQTNASKGKHRYIPARTVRYTHSISITPEAATRFLDPALTDAGFPQRLGWSWAKHPVLATDYDVPDWPGPLDIPMHLNFQIGCTMEVDPGIEKIRRQARIAAHAEMAQVGVALDGHLHLTTRKRAAGLALMDGRFQITMEDFELALIDATTSRNVRSQLQAQRNAKLEDRAKIAGRNDAIRETEKYRYWLNQGVEKIERLVMDSDEPTSSKQAQNAVSYLRQRYGVRYSSIVDEAVARGKVRRIEGVGLARPVGA